MLSYKDLKKIVVTFFYKLFRVFSNILKPKQIFKLNT